MHLRTLLTVSAVIALLLASTTGHTTAQGIMPHAIVGYVKDGGGAAQANAAVTLELQRTGGELTVTANALGQYTADLSSMPGGYQAGDEIRVTASSGDLEGVATVTVTTSALDMCNVTVGEVNQDTAWQFWLPILIGVVLVGTAVAAYIIYKPGKAGDAGAPKMRRRQRK